VPAAAAMAVAQLLRLLDRSDVAQAARWSAF
jgi:hypothetical protein